MRRCAPCATTCARGTGSVVGAARFGATTTAVRTVAVVEGSRTSRTHHRVQREPRHLGLPHRRCRPGSKRHRPGRRWAIVCDHRVWAIVCGLSCVTIVCDHRAQAKNDLHLRSTRPVAPVSSMDPHRPWAVGETHPRRGPHDNFFRATTPEEFTERGMAVIPMYERVMARCTSREFPGEPCPPLTHVIPSHISLSLRACVQG